MKHAKRPNRGPRSRSVMEWLAKILGIETQPGAPDPHVAPNGDGVRCGHDDAAHSFEERVEDVLDTVRPALAADGGNIELVGISGRSARVRLLGACQGCHSATLTLRLGIEKRLREEIPEFEDLIPV